MNAKVDVLAVLQFCVLDACDEEQKASRAAALETVAELVVAANRASALIKAQGEFIEAYRTSGKCPHSVAVQAASLLQARNALVVTGAAKSHNPAKLDAALARIGAGA